MELCVGCVVLLCIVVYVIVQLIRFITGDADLTLLWAHAFGTKPGNSVLI